MIEKFVGLILEYPVAMVTVVFLLIIIVKRSREYANNSYYQITKTRFADVEEDSGKMGEYLIYKHLKKFEKRGARFLFNVYLPKGNGETTEIDVLMIWHQGIVVFESKNYHGRIWGSEWERSWCQVLPARDGQEMRKEFYNPIRQNAAHIRYLKKIVGQQVCMYSVIVFSEECWLSEIEIESKNVFVTKYDEVRGVVKRIGNDFSHELLGKRERRALYERLYPYSQVDKGTKRRHRARMRGRRGG